MIRLLKVKARAGSVAVAIVTTIPMIAFTQTAADDSDKVKQAVTNVRENPEASLIVKAIADAIDLQRLGKNKKAIEKWRAIRNIVGVEDNLINILEGTDHDFAAEAWFSIGYLFRDEDPGGSILAYDRGILLKPDHSLAYYYRGRAKRKLWRIQGRNRRL